MDKDVYSDIDRQLASIAARGVGHGEGRMDDEMGPHQLLVPLLGRL
jgi:hypothetical protein